MTLGDNEARCGCFVCKSEAARLCCVLLSLKISEIFVVGNVGAAHRAQVRRFNLAIDDAITNALEPMGEEYKSEFRPVGHERKHAFADEASAHSDAVEPAHELLFAIHLHARGVAQFVK